jgi:hypothetical protein
LRPRPTRYALGAILYELLTGRSPFVGDTPLVVLAQVIGQEPVPPAQLQPGVPAELEAICLRCLRKAPGERYPTAAALADDLHCFLEGATVAADPARPRSAMQRRRLRWGLAAGAAGLLALAGLLATIFLSPAASDPDAGSREAATAALPPLKGSIDVLISEEDNPDRQNLRLNDVGALPLRPEDRFYVEAKLNRPAYLYVLWIDTDGDVHPLYPWKPDDWKGRPARERPVRRLRRPEALDDCYEVPKGTPGMETLVLLARETPLPPGVDLEAELGKLPKQTAQGRRATVWFENGEEVRDEPAYRGRFDIKRRHDPVLLTQERIRTRLQRYFTYTRAVSFANRGQ